MKSKSISIGGGNRNSKSVSSTIFSRDCLKYLETIPDKSIKLIVTSPPYNLGKEYEKKERLEDYLNIQTEVITKCVDKLKSNDSICWHFGYGLHCSKHLSGHYEVFDR